jgi:hypothetical protein
MRLIYVSWCPSYSRFTVLQYHLAVMCEISLCVYVQYVHDCVKSDQLTYGLTIHNDGNLTIFCIRLNVSMSLPPYRYKIGNLTRISKFDVLYIGEQDRGLDHFFNAGDVYSLQHYRWDIS